jgi:hypothetical protein
VHDFVITGKPKKAKREKGSSQMGLDRGGQRRVCLRATGNRLTILMDYDLMEWS